MDFAIIGGLLYLSNIMNTYFPKKKKIEREKNEVEINIENKNEIKNILNLTLCNYLESSDSLSKNLNEKYFKDKFDKERVIKYNEFSNKLRDNIHKLQESKQRMFNYFKKSENKDTKNISFPELEDKTSEVYKEIENRKSMEEGDITITLGDIYRLYVDFDIYTLSVRDKNLDIDFNLFKNELLPDKFNINKVMDEIKLTKIEIYEIIKHVLLLEYIKEKIHRDDDEIAEIILLSSLWKFCLFFKDILSKINISDDEKSCLLNISESHFEDFYKKTLNDLKDKKNKNKICDHEALRNKLCSETINEIVEKVTEDKLLNFRLVDFFENESVNEVTIDDLMFDMII